MSSLLLCSDDDEIEKTTEELVEEMANDYAEYVRVDISQEKKLVEETTDELLTKLEELMSLVDLVRSDSSQCLGVSLPKIKGKCEELQKVFHNIDKLEAFVDMVRENVELLETKVDLAEKELLPVNSLSKLFKPLFSKKASSKQRKTCVTYDPPTIFETEKHFQSTSG